MQGIDNFNSGKYVGKYRLLPVRISGSSMVVPNFIKVPDLMEKLFAKISKFNLLTHPATDLAVMTHLELVTIHPYTGGSPKDYEILMYKNIENSLDLYLNSLNNVEQTKEPQQPQKQIMHFTNLTR